MRSSGSFLVGSLLNAIFFRSTVAKDGNLKLMMCKVRHELPLSYLRVQGESPIDVRERMTFSAIFCRISPIKKREL